MKERMTESISNKIQFLEEVDNISKAAQVIIESYKKGGKVISCGNGGSAADAQHLTAELVNKFKLDRKPLAAISLTVDTSVLTSWGNDQDFSKVFERQVEAHGKPEDVLIAISTSGNSKNVLIACEKAREMGLKIISLSGKDGGKLKELSDVNINSRAQVTERIQECHLIAYHIICEIVEAEMAELEGGEGVGEEVELSEREVNLESVNRNINNVQESESFEMI
ncbi:SIS domain-containing protein [archaeon]|nr:SIS domain-containing protein [archaeon]MBT4241403.1 SIS domain-containing protein [archaeon]MBT4418224.1 SIS domain-containing protein [archaeon]